MFVANVGLIPLATVCKPCVIAV